MSLDAHTRARWEGVRDAMLFLRGLQEEGFPLDEGAGTLLRVAHRILGEGLPADPVGAFRPGDRVNHRHFGQGIVIRSYGSGEDEQVRVIFPVHGEKAFIAGYARLEKV